ncbi:peptidoglycan-binding domain-containing protein [Actinacidiphila sp. bgisy160]|uniref:peptidoglycan-binding domain-containing protein n=1 Tax=Actinacidiphila sp. bgisy160 TaxID=3413796 RepID=UPI003D75A373
MASDKPGSPASQEEHEYESLRVRPYVPGPEEYADADEAVTAAVAAGAAEAFPSHDADPPTAPLAPVPPEGAAGAARPDEDTDLIDLGTVSSDRLPVPVAAASRELAPYPSPAVSRRRAGAHRRRRGALVAGAGIGAVGLAVGAVFLTAQLTGIPDRTEAAPDQGASEPAVELPTSARPSSSASRPASPSVTPSTLASASASASASATTGTPTPSATASQPTASAGGQVSQPPSSAPPAAPATLRRGDTGPAVVDLQNRLKAVRLYYGPSNGDYDRKVGDAVARFQFFYGVKGDPQGVYGPNTRAALEAKTGATPNPDSGDGGSGNGPG